MRHLLVGCGPAAVVAAETLRTLDPDAQICMVGDEPEPPYSRMALPYLLRREIEESGTHLRKRQDHFAERGIEVVQARVERVEDSEVQLTGGERQPYDRLLISTGATPLTPPIDGIEHPRVTRCWTLADARQIAEHLRPGAEVVLIGAGFIGCIVLEALAKAEAKLTVIESGPRMVPRMLDQTCGELLQHWCEQRGVTVLTERQVRAIEPDGERVRVTIEGHEAVPAELVIVATGVRPNGQFLESAGIELGEDGAVRVDDYLQSSQINVFAAGDVASGRDFSTGEYTTQAIQPTAVEHARVAAHNMHRAKSLRHRGSLSMNVLDTLGLVSTSYGRWQGVDGGDAATLVDRDGFRYLNLQFEADRLVGANSLGLTQHIGVLRGLIGGHVHLGGWAARLRENPLQLMEAYLACAQMGGGRQHPTWQSPSN